ncbi:MAG: hypothetical protein M1815_002468 [Lichina confinis]|nr:MAG: hypothetical protein M1815_002468 [Lichina confinis]
MTTTAIRHIAVVGATGKLAIPVIEAMVKNGYAVRALVRDEAKAKKMLPVSVEVVPADLRRPESVARALQGQDAVYINLSTLTERLDLPFYEEREGVSVIVEAAKENGLRHIYKIGAANDQARPGTSLTTPESIRVAGNRFIEEGGIPYTIFEPTMFMENVEHQLTEDNMKWRWIGDPTRGRFLWIGADDYAQQVMRAIGNPRADNRHYLMQGPEPLTAQEVFDRFRPIFNPDLKLETAPLYITKMLGWFNPTMRYLSHIFEAFGRINETAGSRDAWEELGRPTVTVEEFARRLKEKRGNPVRGGSR